MKKDVKHLGDYWDSIANIYNDAVTISLDEFHYGPLVPGDSVLKLLPSELNGKRCLEVGAGAGQNSIYLAKNGASCIATDISDKQLEYGRIISDEENVDVEFKCASMEELNLEEYGEFDLIHSSYAITFSPCPQDVISHLSKMLKPGGTLLISTGHPLFTGEWLELDGEDGLFLTNYFEPEPDVRLDDDENERVRSNFYPISEMADWMFNAGLVIERIQEPKPLAIERMSPAQIKNNVPYSSKGWCEYYPQLKNVPALVIFKCRKL